MDVEAALRADSIDDASISTFPVHCGRHFSDWDRFIQPLQKKDSHCEHTCLLGGACFAGYNARTLSSQTEIRVIHKPVCFEYLMGGQMIAWLVHSGAYLVTPGWLGHWRQRVEEMGLDTPAGKNVFAKSIRKLVLLDTGTAPGIANELKHLSQFLQLPAETIPIGLEYLRLELRQIVENWRHTREIRRIKESAGLDEQSVADFVLLSELLGELAEVAEEARVLGKITAICRSLFCPAQWQCVGIDKKKATHNESNPNSLPLPSNFIQEVENEREDFGFNRNGTGFWMKLLHRRELVGWIAVDGFAFPEHRKHYMNLALIMGRIFALCIQNARTYARIEDTVGELRHEVSERQQLTLERENLISQLQDHLAKIKTLQGLLPICSGCKKIRDDDGNWDSVESYVQARTNARFSHGMCPECIEKWFPGLKR